MRQYPVGKYYFLCRPRHFSKTLLAAARDKPLLGDILIVPPTKSDCI